MYYVQKLPGIRFRYRRYQLRVVLECAALSFDFSPMHFFFRNYLKEDIYDSDSTTTKELKNAIVSELSRLPSQIAYMASEIRGQSVCWH